MILVVDDSRDNAVLVSRLLKLSGYEAVTAYSGEDMFAHLRSDAMPNLVILDVRMPDMDGWQCLATLRANPLWKNIAVIMYTADASLSGITDAKRLGAQAYLVKGSVAWSDFLQKVQSFLTPSAGTNNLGVSGINLSHH